MSACVAGPHYGGLAGLYAPIMGGARFQEERAGARVGDLSERAAAPPLDRIAPPHEAMATLGRVWDRQERDSVWELSPLLRDSVWELRDSVWELSPLLVELSPLLPS